jgi:hypothetical protein
VHYKLFFKMLGHLALHLGNRRLLAQARIHGLYLLVLLLSVFWLLPQAVEVLAIKALALAVASYAISMTLL